LRQIGALRALLAECLVSTAIVEAAKKRYISAIEALEKSYKLNNTSGPDELTDPFVNLLYASIAMRLGRTSTLLDTSTTILVQLNDSSRKRYSQYDINYMQYFIKLMLISASKTGNSDTAQLASTVKISYAMLRPDRVKERIRRIFPFSETFAKMYEDILISWK
jgi:hypothetical protein